MEARRGFLRLERRGVPRRFGDSRLQSIEKTQSAAAALSVGAALLVESFATGPVFVSVGAYDDGVLDRVGGELLLSIAWRGRLFFLAISIAVSRIVLGMHFLSDVLAGMVLGVALGCASITAFASLGWV